jgi:hypothetical protein
MSQNKTDWWTVGHIIGRSGLSFVIPTTVADPQDVNLFEDGWFTGNLSYNYVRQFDRLSRRVS